MNKPQPFISITIDLAPNLSKGQEAEHNLVDEDIADIVYSDEKVCPHHSSDFFFPTGGKHASASQSSDSDTDTDTDEDTNFNQGTLHTAQASGGQQLAADLSYSPDQQDSLAHLWVTLLNLQKLNSKRRAVWVEVYCGGSALHIDNKFTATSLDNLPLTSAFAIFYRRHRRQFRRRHASITNPATLTLADQRQKLYSPRSRPLHEHAVYCLRLRNNRLEEVSPTSFKVYTHSGEGSALLVEVSHPGHLQTWLQVFNLGNGAAPRSPDILPGQSMITMANVAVANSRDGGEGGETSGVVGSCKNLTSSTCSSPRLLRRAFLSPLSQIAEQTE